MFLSLTVNAKPSTLEILLWNHNILLPICYWPIWWMKPFSVIRYIFNQHLSAIYNFWNMTQFVWVTSIPSNITDLVWTIIFTIELMLLFLIQTDTSNYFGQVESQFVSDINKIVYLFIVPNQLLYPLHYIGCSEISLKSF